MMRLTAVLTLSWMCAPAFAGDDAQAKIKVGQKAPDFTLKDHEGKDVKLSDLCKEKKKNVLLAFYPKDFTGG